MDPLTTVEGSTYSTRILLLDATELDDNFTELLLDTLVSLLLELTNELEEGFSPGSMSLLLLDAALNEDFAELLLEPSEDEDLPPSSLRELEEFVAISLLLLDFAKLLLDSAKDEDLAFELLDFTFELLEPSQFLQTEDEETSSESVTELLPISSPQATNNVATTPIIKNFFKAINFTPTNHNIKFAEALRGQTQSQRLMFFF
jgi:hypothetical protein